MFGGQVGLGGHITIGDNANVGAQSGIISNLEPNAKVLGAPAIPVKDYFRSSVIFSKLPEMYRQISQLQKEIDALKSNKQ
jgi:UDP-3-O-[3-hydroxymyristoyl] glucosamine N-acyltransferase